MRPRTGVTRPAHRTAHREGRCVPIRHSPSAQRDMKEPVGHPLPTRRPGLPGRLAPLRQAMPVGGKAKPAGRTHARPVDAQRMGAKGGHGVNASALPSCSASSASLLPDWHPSCSCTPRWIFPRPTRWPWLRPAPCITRSGDVPAVQSTYSPSALS